MILANTAGFRGVFSAPLYCASKHGVVGFVRSMQKLDEMEGIKVVGVAPGYVVFSLSLLLWEFLRIYGI